MLSVCFKNLSHIRDLSALCKEGSLGQVRNLKPWEASLLKGRVTWQFSCNSGRAPVGSILIGVFMQWSSWLIGSGVNQMGVFILAVILLSTLVPSIFGFWKHLLKYSSWGTFTCTGARSFPVHRFAVRYETCGFLVACTKLHPAVKCIHTDLQLKILSIQWFHPGDVCSCVNFFFLAVWMILQSSPSTQRLTWLCNSDSSSHS